MSAPDAWGEADAASEVRVIRSSLDPAVWVAVPFGIGADQSWALHPGRLHAVFTWAAGEFAEAGQAVTWRRLDRDCYVMELQP